jgi:hypothetical protein|tara:strand:- start:10 stop:114 length:105 start_codon:yes stop_codon:yes gene_type:complete
MGKNILKKNKKIAIIMGTILFSVPLIIAYLFIEL